MTGGQSVASNRFRSTTYFPGSVQLQYLFPITRCDSTKKGKRHAKACFLSEQSLSSHFISSVLLAPPPKRIQVLRRRRFRWIFVVGISVDGRPPRTQLVGRPQAARSENAPSIRVVFWVIEINGRTMAGKLSTDDQECPESQQEKIQHYTTH